MKNLLSYLVLSAVGFVPLGAQAQYASPPGYTFGGMFPGMFGNNNYYGMPQGYMNNGQSPFLTMPAPQYPMANPQFPVPNQPQAAPFPANPMAQPTPFWMQTPPSQQPPARYITEVPSNTAPQNAPPNYSVFTAPGFTTTPPRWAPLPGQSPAPFQDIRPSNNWSIFPNASQAPVQPVPATPPKWPTP